MSKFIKLFKTTLEKYGYIPSPDKGEEFNELVTIFEEKENYTEFFEKIEAERKDGSSSSLLRLLKGIISQGKIIDNSLIPTLGKLSELEGSNEHFDATLIDIFFELTPTKEEKEEFIKIILSKPDKKYVVYESLLIHVTKYYTEDDALFCDVYLESLNSKRGNYIGVHWFQEAYIRIAKSEDLQRFIETLYTPEYKKAFELFIDGNEETLRLFFENIPPVEENFELFKKILISNSEGENPDYILSGYSGYNKKIFLDAVFAFLSKSGNILPYVKDFLGTNYGIFETREYIAHYIALEEVAKLGVILADKLWGIVQLYEYIENQTTRTDKEKIISEIKKIPGFDEEMEKTRLSREKYEQEEKERVEKQNVGIIADIQLASTIDEKEPLRISPLLIDLYKKHKDKDLFTKEQLEIVKEHLKRFFAWELFPLDKVEFSRTLSPTGAYTYSYTNNIWYKEGFFLDALKLAHELGVEYPSHDKLVRGLALLWIGDEAKRELLPAIGSLSREDIETLGKVYDGSRTDQLCEFMGGQNFFEIYRAFESDWKREKAILRKILYAFIEKHEVEDYVRERTIEILADAEIWDEVVDRPFIVGLWETEIRKYPENIVENYERKYSYLLTINQLLINLGDEDAINWRFDQLLSAKVDFPDPWEDYENNGYARGISDLESELSHDGIIISGIGNIDINKYADKIFELFDYGVELIRIDKVAYGMFASYLIGKIFDIILHQNSEVILKFNKKFELIIDQYSSEEVRLVNYKFQEFNKRIEARTVILPIEEANLPEDEEKISVFLRTEGESDIIHLSNAIKYINPELLKICKFENGRSASELQRTFEYDSYNSNEILICISDYDEAGIRGFYRNGSYCGLSSNIGECGLKNIKNKFYIIVPITSDTLLAQVINPLSDNSISEDNADLGRSSLFRNGKPEFVIEHLFYFDGFNQWNDRFFEIEKRGIGEYTDNVTIPSKREIGDNDDSKKVEFAKKIEQIAIQEFSMKGEELYRNFKPLLNKIAEIIDNQRKSK